VTTNYRCDPEMENSEYTELPIIKHMAPVAPDSNVFEADYTIYRDGDVTVSVVLARRGGLWAEYFNNAFLHGVPALSRVDNYLDFDWQEGLVTKEASDFVSVHWYGKLQAPLTEDFTFIIKADDGVRFYFEHQLVIDRWDFCCDD
jgi:hypothetical protein